MIKKERFLMSPKEEMLKAITEILTLACLQEEASFSY